MESSYSFVFFLQRERGQVAYIMLDINSPLGQEALAGEREAVELFLRHYPVYRYVSTPKALPASVDGFLEREGVVQAVVEVKVRSMTRDKLREYGDEWLLTADKVERGRLVSAELCIPFVGFLYLLPERRLLTLAITDQEGRYMFDYHVRETYTKKTCNGGDALRFNAYLPVGTAREYH